MNRRQAKSGNRIVVRFRSKSTLTSSGSRSSSPPLRRVSATTPGLEPRPG